MAILRVYNPLTQSWDPIPYIKGDKGDRGYDVTTVEYEYYSSTSSSEPTGGEWSTIMPGYSEGRYIWVRTKTTNSHGEAYTGTPVLATLFNDVNSAELTRRTYETNRANAETARDTAEGLRDSAEIARASAELLRVSAETSRGNSEVSRANAEAQRVSAESSRVSVEAQRVANEEQRISNENARIAAQGRYPIVQNSTWWVWSKEDDDYVDTEVTAVGANGVGIASIELTSTVDLVDTYTITFDDGNTTSFDVTNGADGISPTITVTEITGGHEVAVTDAEGTQTFDVMDGEVSEEQLETALIDKADVITSSASGEIVTIADGGKDLPVVDLKVSLLPVQSGSGDPSPDNVRPISGWTGVEVYRCGTDYDTYSNQDTAINGVNVKISDHRVKLKGTTTAQIDKYLSQPIDGTGETLTLNVSHPMPDSHSFWYVYDNTASSVKLRLYGTTATSGTFETVVGHQYRVGCLIINGTSIDIDAWVFVTKGNIGTIPISWQTEAGTVYGCHIDPVSGVLKVTHGIADMGDTNWNADPNRPGVFYDAISGRRSGSNILVCSAYQVRNIFVSTSYDCYISGGISYGGNAIFFRDTSMASFTTAQVKTAVTGYKVIYELETPLTFQLSETQIATFLGTNNFWSNGNGQIDLEYRCDTKLYIEQLTKPTEDDMTANANIQSGKFFMVGNRLMLSTTAIAQGEQIVVGTNCSELSLADGLNLLNS